MKFPILLLVAGLAACTAPILPPDPVFPVERRSAVNRLRPSVDLVQPARFAGFELSATRADPVSFANVPLCEASELVLANILGLDVSCTGAGTISLAFASGDASVLFALFDAAVRRSGGAVRVVNGGISVSGGAGAGGAFEQAPTDRSGQLGLSDPVTDGFTTGDLPPAVNELLARRSLSVSDKLTVSLPLGISAGDASALVSEIGLDVGVMKLGGGVVALGSERDLAVLSGLSDAFELVTVAVPVPDLSGDTVAALAATFQLVNFQADNDLGVLWVSGDRQSVLDVLNSTKRFLPQRGDLLLEAVFVSVDASSLKSLTSSAGFRSVSGDLAISSPGFVGMPSLVVQLDQLSSRGKAVIESRPRLVTSSGRSASFVSGDQVPVVAGVDENSVQSFEYIETGTIIRAKPLALASGLIRIDLSIEVSSAGRIAENGNPVISKRVVETSVEVTSGDVVLLSGLDQLDRSSGSSRKLGIFPSRSSAGTDLKLAFFLAVSRQ